MCLKDVSLQLYTLQLKRRWGVCLAATPKDCHKPINTTRASTSPPTQMMSAFIRRVVIPPQAVKPLRFSCLSLHQKARKAPRLLGLPTAPLLTGRSERSTQKLSCVLHAHAHFANSGIFFFFGAKRQTRKCSTFHHRKAQPLLQLLWLQDFYKVSVPLHPSNPFLDFITTE